MRSGSPSPPSFNLSSFRCGDGLGVGGHLRRVAEAERVAGHGGLRRRQAGEIPGALAGLLGCEVPQRTVERIARGAGGQQRGQPSARQRPPQAVERLDRVVDAFAVARIGDGFAASAVAAAGDMRDDDMRLGLGAAGDDERLGQRPGFGLGFDELRFGGRGHVARQPRRPEAWARNR